MGFMRPYLVFGFFLHFCVAAQNAPQEQIKCDTHDKMNDETSLVQLKQSIVHRSAAGGDPWQDTLNGFKSRHPELKDLDRDAAKGSRDYSMRDYSSEDKQEKKPAEGAVLLAEKDAARTHSDSFGSSAGPPQQYSSLVSAGSSQHAFDDPDDEQPKKRHSFSDESDSVDTSNSNDDKPEERHDFQGDADTDSSSSSSNSSGSASLDSSDSNSSDYDDEEDDEEDQYGDDDDDDYREDDESSTDSNSQGSFNSDSNDTDSGSMQGDSGSDHSSSLDSGSSSESQDRSSSRSDAESSSRSSDSNSDGSHSGSDSESNQHKHKLRGDEHDKEIERRYKQDRNSRGYKHGSDSAEGSSSHHSTEIGWGGSDAGHTSSEDFSSTSHSSNSLDDYGSKHHVRDEAATAQDDVKASAKLRKDSLSSVDSKQDSESSSGSESKAMSRMNDAAKLAMETSSTAFARKIVREVFELGRKQGVFGVKQDKAHKFHIGEHGGNGAQGDGDHQQDVVTIVRQNGVFRGVDLTPGAPDNQHRRVVQFKAEPLALPDIEKQKAMVFNSDVSSQEGSIRSTRVNCVDKTNQVVSKYGVGAFAWPALGEALTGCSPVESTGLNFGSVMSSTDRQEYAGHGESQADAQLDKKGMEYSMAVYTLEPRAIFNVNDRDLEPTPDFITDVNRVVVDSGDSSMMQAISQFSIQDLFNKYGTHSCTKVTLGGWWRTSADYKSNKMQSLFKMNKAVTQALDKSRATREKEGNKAANTQAFYANDDTGMTEIHNSWKGGISGGTAEEFRESLGGIGAVGECSKNGNWRVIDKDVDQCRGIWAFIPSTHLKLAVCKEWAKLIIYKMGITDVSETALTAACGTGRATIQEFREALESFKLKPTKKENPPCLTYTCPLGYEIKPNTDLTRCASTECGLADRDTCCQKPNAAPAPPVSMAPTNVFMLRVRTSNAVGCNTNSKVYALVDDQEGSTVSASINADSQHHSASTGWQNLQGVDPAHDNFEQGGLDEFSVPVLSGTKFVPKRVCVMTSGEWCPATEKPAVSVYDAMKAKGPSAMYGTASGFLKFISPAPQCEPIVHSQTAEDDVKAG